ncbi:restriction endonuclease subunit S [Aphanothece minutissima]|uniref:Restriction endonuclease subunit S n=1 Tax=Aphanothece cf. minutissima CCALA 015 TaxID=2107695 RepID=A0ABX5F7G1_9CHRO|nr:restriction endonuclease subunit S [Aphanothece minutissima]PSB37542.1 restriction endonuclease subunit S [Aphanothece cf. minutissima CCALA 015]
MAGDWKSSPLAELCEQIADCPHSTPAWRDSGVIVLRNQNIRGGRLDLSSPSYTDEAHFEQRSRRARLKSGDLVLTREAPMGEVCMIPDNLRCCLGQRMVMLRPDPEKCDSRFLLYAIQSDTVQHEIKVNEGTGSTVSNLRIPLLEALPIPCPPLAEQKAIAAVLGALDDMIELNRRMTATLEAMARALFQSWFVDFDPVRAKLDGRQPIGIDPGTAALFPERLECFETVHIPKGWKLGTIQDCCVQIQNGGTPRRNEPRYWDDGSIPWLASGEVRQSIITATESFITEEGLAESSAKWVPAFSTVVALYGATAGQVSFISCHLTTNQAVCALIPKQGFTFFNYCTMLEAITELENKAVGSAQQNISKGIVEKTRVILPPPVLVERFSTMVRPLFEHWISNLNQSRILTNLRDTLLPKLLSGESTPPIISSQ